MSKVLLKHLLSVVILSAIGGFLIAGCGKDQFATGNGASSSSANGAQPESRVEPPSKPGKYGGTFTDSSIADPKTFNPWVAAETSSTGAVGGLTDSLISQNPYSLKWEGHLAELPEISKDGLTWTFHLKPNLKWSDGQPLTADDVIFTLDVIFDEKVQTNMRESMLVDVPDGKGGYKRVPPTYEKVDAQTVQFKFPVRYSVAREMLSFPIAPKHKLYKYWKQGQPSGTGFNSAWGVNVNVHDLVSCGPWIIQSYVPRQRIVYNRNPYYWRKGVGGQSLPYLDHLVTLIVQDSNTEQLKFEAGDTDVLGIQHKDYPRLKGGEAKGNYKVMNLGPSWGNSFICFNENPNSAVAKRSPWKINLFRDPRFRQAVSYAIDRKRISDDIFLGMATPMWGPVSPANTLFFNPHVPEYPYSIDKAKALLAQIGLKDTNGDGILEYQGHPVKFTILTNVENNQRVAIMAIIANDLKQLGLDVSYAPIDFNKLVSMLDPKPPAPYDWEAFVMGFTGGPEPYDGRNVWQSSGNLHQWYPYQKKPSTKWEAEIDDIFRESGQEMDVAKRRELFNRWQVIAASELPMVYTVIPDALIAVRNGFGNVKPCALAGVTWNSDELYSLQATKDQP
jgi:peptide/nickel transport system substrate-binding protein